MTDVLCPLCNEMITGEGTVDLSLALQDHFRLVHRSKGLWDLKKGTARPGRGKTMWTMVREEDMLPISFEEEAIKESHGPTERKLPGEDIPQAVRCPLCGEVVRGFALDDLSYNLAKHVSFVHDLKVKWMGKG